jgi:hypothetical protein
MLAPLGTSLLQPLGEHAVEVLVNLGTLSPLYST